MREPKDINNFFLLLLYTPIYLAYEAYRSLTAERVPTLSEVEKQRTTELVTQAQTSLSTVPTPHFTEVWSEVYDRLNLVRGEKLPTPEILRSVKYAIEVLYAAEMFGEPLEEPLIGDGIEGARYRDRLRSRLEKTSTENIELVKAAITESMDAFLECLPGAVYYDLDTIKADEEMRNKGSSLTFELPLVDFLPDVGSHIQGVIDPFITSPAILNAKLFNDVRVLLTRNIYQMSGQEYPPRAKGAPRLKMPGDSGTEKAWTTPRDICHGYLKGTPLLQLFGSYVPFTIPLLSRFEHQWLVSPPGTGKSTTLSAMILQDLDLVARNEASVIVMESNRDLIKSIEGLKQFAPGGDLEGRLVVIDVEDVDYPIAINLFDVGLSEINQASPRDKEALLNSAVSMLDYVFRALLGAELTSRQSTLFNFTIQLLIHIPEATLDTLIDLMQPGGLKKYAEYVKLLDRDSRQFFDLKFNSDEFRQTKSQVTDRIFAIKRIRSLARMFSAPKTKLDLFKEMGEGKVILINAAKSLLQEDGVEVFGRFFLASILLAAEKRQLLAKDDRMPTFVYIDEAHDIIRRDEKISILLDQARKFRVAMILAHQRLDQLTPPVQNALFGSTAIKFAAQLSDANASALARNMGTTPEFILKQPPYSYAVSVRGLTKTAISLSIPFVDLNKQERMTAAESSAVRDQMRRRYAVHRSEVERPDLPPPSAPEPPADGAKASPNW